MKKEPTPKNPYPYCLCGCGRENNPGRKFKQGHDARVKSRIKKVKSGKESADTLPDELIAAAMTVPGFEVVTFTADDILSIAGDRATRENWVIKRGEIWWTSLPEPSGFGTSYPRAVLIIQDNRFNDSQISTAIVAVVTSNLGLAEVPGNVFLSIEGSGLPKDSVVNVSQILTIDKALFTERVGLLPPETMAAIDGGLRLALGL